MNSQAYCSGKKGILLYTYKLNNMPKKFGKNMNKIRNRDIPSDVFYTPIDICKKAINMVDNHPDYIWLDPCRGTGNFYNHFPTENKKEWCEITEEKDFFEYSGKADVICSNPPFSKIEKFLLKCIELNPRYIVFILGMLNMTPRRIEMLNNGGYYLTKMHMFRVEKWFGNSIIFFFEKTCEENQMISYDRKIYNFVTN